MDPQATAPYFVHSFEPPAEPQQASTGIRVLAAGGGAVALLLGSVLSLGLGLVALLGLGLTALVWRAKKARLTRRASWIGAVLAVTVTIGGLMTWGVANQPGSAVESMQASMDRASREPPPPIVERMRRFGPPPNPRVQSRVDSVARSKAFMWWMLVMMFAFGSLFFGLLVGTPAWGCVMLIGYGIRGRWPMARPQAAPGPAPGVSAVRLPLIVP